ncbi:MAG: SIS domain-containing protein [Nitrospirae bacterium]|nr:SIS domain-containing protein [Nitrospirota bacterium]
MTSIYYEHLFTIANSIGVTNSSGERIGFDDAVSKVVDIAMQTANAKRTVYFIGNGGSAAISSHMAVDFLKNGGIKAMAFNDGPLLTCLGNDYGYQHVFEKPVEMFARGGDVLFAISSSGRSENILLGVQAAREKGCSVITLSGFDNDNPLLFKGDINFYVPSSSYGIVEVIHHTICHCILDSILKKKNG